MRIFINHKKISFKIAILIVRCILIIFVMLAGLCHENEVYGADENGNIVIVIDPGHGGLRGEADDGAINGDIVERYINMAVAKSMQNELSKYEGVKVYLTHDSEDVSMSLRERSEFAKSVNADFLFSIHFNASELHGKYGAEVWIPSIGSYYAAGYRFADIELEELSKLGLFMRGIKTRIGDDGDEYYGIIRENEWRGINAVIIEHCYVDNKEDRKYIENAENLEKFGRIDATAAAKYFGLKSEELGVDYSDYEKLEVSEPETRVYPDNTPPDTCSISLKYIGNNSITFSINAKDTDSYINYYSYSLDGGKTFSDLKAWNNKWNMSENDESQTASENNTMNKKQTSDLENLSTNDDSIDVTLTDVNVDVGKLIVRVYNRDDVSADSNVIELNGIMQRKSNKTESNNRSSEMKSFIKNNRNTFIGTVLIMCGIIITFIYKKKIK